MTSLSWYFRASGVLVGYGTLTAIWFASRPLRAAYRVALVGIDGEAKRLGIYPEPGNSAIKAGRKTGNRVLAKYKCEDPQCTRHGLLHFHEGFRYAQ